MISKHFKCPHLPFGLESEKVFICTASRERCTGSFWFYLGAQSPNPFSHVASQGLSVCERLRICVVAADIDMRADLCCTLTRLYISVVGV